MQSRDKQDVVIVLYLVLAFPLELPVCIIDQYQDARPAINVSRRLEIKPEPHTQSH